MTLEEKQLGRCFWAPIAAHLADRKILNAAETDSSRCLCAE
jgi:hypothetical protein